MLNLRSYAMMHLVKSMACDQSYSFCLENLWGKNKSASVFLMCYNYNANVKLLSRLSQYTSSVASSALDKVLTCFLSMYQPDLCRIFENHLRE